MDCQATRQRRSRVRYHRSVVRIRMRGWGVK